MKRLFSAKSVLPRRSLATSLLIASTQPRASRALDRPPPRTSPSPPPSKPPSTRRATSPAMSALAPAPQQPQQAPLRPISKQRTPSPALDSPRCCYRRHPRPPRSLSASMSTSAQTRPPCPLPTSRALYVSEARITAAGAIFAHPGLSIALGSIGFLDHPPPFATY